MKKILFGLSCLMFLGCTTVQKPLLVGQSMELDGKVYTKISETLILTKDKVTTEEFIEVGSVNYESDVLDFKSLFFRIKSYPNKKEEVYFIVSDFSNRGLFGAGDLLFCRGVLLSDGKETVKFDINNRSRIDSALLPSVRMKKGQFDKLYKIINSKEEVTIRVYTEKGTYDVKYDKAQNKGINDLYKYLNKK